MDKNKTVSVVAVIVIAVFGYLMYAGGGGVADKNATEKEVGPWKYDTFAQCLTEKGMQMYGSVTCATCAKQRKLFGDSFQYITEIECNPRYPHPQTARCVAKMIESTPTWVLELPDQTEVKRMRAGLQIFEELAEFSGCTFTEDKL
ncbi:MAG: hypothetical protein A2942_00680 [Candidatus Lloydbacteria bacterium RIFCSPLOWO2_01_FULL_50_20]|uniref:Vitamin K epoxide reductase domain-containing protein n=1 Tax=Candidatus Lloydbacteria bacterium RIFCSPLOWO2_01_FULL_50_20 TaxID=1798665 RepID=A0A1G2DHK5_9BACT|nr:MAG: hypothetical protein A3C13_02625 [Candidatus Lloydbacteria bacterium RIFCSPHIGHO2_02_FULL_50_11]OGZ13036.1 MAG: hypothetical protein A2942_00680 [Candidatus Lloydbacteria bacterium RIFCSPLOWO2_01_FULL_50_20]